MRSTNQVVGYELLDEAGANKSRNENQN